MIERKEHFRSILAEYYSQLKWLDSLITDPTGERYLRKKTKEERWENFQTTFTKMTDFLNYLDNPQNQYPAVHIAGTGGKGSVTTMIGAILRQADLRVGVHTSPYLQVPNEKWMIDGKMISPSSLTRVIKGLRPRYDQFVNLRPANPPSYVLTQVALTHQMFADEKVDWGVIETAMGGRFDPTNIINSQMTVITNIDYDHVEALGPTLEDIAYHKAGIIKPGVPVVSGVKQKEVLFVVEKEASEKSAPLFLLGRDFNYRVREASKNGVVVDIQGPYKKYLEVTISLPGLFQAENAALAVASADVLSHLKGFDLDSSSVNQALSTLNFGGRMEIVQESPTIILDGAHNPQKMKALAESLKGLYPDRRLLLIIGMLATKDVADSVVHLLPQTSRVITAQPKVVGKPSLNSGDLSKVIKGIDPNIKISSAKDVLEAIGLAQKEAAEDDLILVTGSLYMLGEAREHWHPKEEILFEAEYR